MRADWDRRAQEDAAYYVAFGRRRQSSEEFFASAADVLRELGGEFARFPADRPLSEMAALEIGCGPGRLMLPLSRRFGRISGVDVSAEMVELARRNLDGASNASVQVSSGSDLADFGDASIDFVYSYAVFQHIPSRDVVLSYLREAVRVLKPGGILKAQVSSLPRDGESSEPAVAGWTLRAGVPRRTALELGLPDTWSGVSFAGEEIAAFCRAQGLRLLALDGFETQYLWFTARKPDDEAKPASGATTIAGIGNTFTDDKLIPASGRFASASLWVKNLPRQADLNTLRATVDGVEAAPSYLGWRDAEILDQVNFYLPPGVRRGMVPVGLLLDGEPLAEARAMRVIPAAPLLARIVSVSDGVNLLSDLAIETRTLKIGLEEAPQPDAASVASEFSAALGDTALTDVRAFCVDPLARRFEVNLQIPGTVAPGAYNLTCRLAGRRFAPIGLQIR